MGEQDQHGHRSQHYCRGCGGLLPLGTRALFHPDCLKADKRERMRGKRRLEREKFERWMKLQRCPGCGARLAGMPKNNQQPIEKGSCEASHGTLEPREHLEPGEIHPAGQAAPASVTDKGATVV